VGVGDVSVVVDQVAVWHEAIHRHRGPAPGFGHGGFGVRQLGR
jgi:hypothetical protein